MEAGHAEKEGRSLLGSNIFNVCSKYSLHFDFLSTLCFSSRGYIYIYIKAGLGHCQYCLLFGDYYCWFAGVIYIFAAFQAFFHL